MATFNKINSFITEMANGTHANLLNADTDVLKAGLTNTAPTAADDVFGDLTEITA